MKTRVWAALAIFVGSYLPLSAILLIQNIDFDMKGYRLCWPLSKGICTLPIKHPIFSISVFLVCLVCLLVTLIALFLLRPKRKITILEAKHVPSDLMNYTLPYVVSFMSIDYQDLSKFIGMVIFLLWMFWITYRSGQIFFNPALIAFGWKLYDVKYESAGDASEYSAYVLSNIFIEPNGVYKYVQAEDLLITKG